MKIISIVGARPQFIKAALVSKKLRTKGIKEILVHTGQHYDFNMSDVFFSELELPKPEYYLGIGSGNHGEQTGKMLIEIEKVLLKEKPDVVIVYGDTNSTLAGALAAIKLHISVAHVEAGLRSFNKEMPEEINRVLTDHVSKWLFAPTETAVKNLHKEGIFNGIYNVGDVMFDVALESIQRVNEKEILEKHNVRPKRFILATIHRAENTDVKENLENIWQALNEIALIGWEILFPIHPRTEKALRNFGIDVHSKSKNLLLIPPVSYFEMLALEKNARLIITDSGGVQKEGYFWGTPCVIPRNETEWVELIEIGFNKLTGTKKEDIVKCVTEMVTKMEEKLNIGSLYGRGNASDRIVEVLVKS
ncbi:UDP-N-acetylglucosamine 2-epimerase (non-hydrolysing)/UDP-GlcNAc3NAcA epimerase [Balnearium lithotrophicum]|uniref:UDP-N-acetylglucosamine 2-epimerase (Non-hydrolysing)/UDP-GlcNAc3NAcA epimerase n=1 Tax=Balnearium lithotrophicum TaxID=223788 RepID=A0A521C7I5_9BACT|nr:UDP-N-acetylglucosamine 2-epimerase (non-hydrolyzing) [Balnearium lithotrophicum]SMO55343.1 UDP-N-acetylglucosamine 2-epimerase (non-hydrolysing)/UDP-GlcNAc3NAcA epimerase [Balnearium lithotrophicum]